MDATEEQYLELIRRLQANSLDHFTRKITGTLIVACIISNKQLLKGIIIAVLSDVSRSMGKKRLLDLYNEHEVVFNLTSTWFLNSFYDEMITNGSDVLPSVWMTLVKLHETSKMGYLGTLDPTFLPSEYCLFRYFLHISASYLLMLNS